MCCRPLSVSSVLCTPLLCESSDVRSVGSRHSFAPVFAVFGLQRVDSRRALCCSVGTFIWVQSGHHGFTRESRDPQESWCGCSFRCKGFAKPLLLRIEVDVPSTHGTYACSTETQTCLQKLNWPLGTPSELPSTVTALLKVRNSLPRL